MRIFFVVWMLPFFIWGMHVDERVVGFFPINEEYRDLRVNFEIEADCSLYQQCELWNNLSLQTAMGRLVNWNISGGARYLFCLLPRLQFYLGAGLNGAIVDDRTGLQKRGLGGVMKAGVYCSPMNNLYLELYTDYLYQRIEYSQIGGVKVGGGVGFTF